MKKLALVVAITLLLVTGFLGIPNGIDDIGDAQSGLQRSVSVAVIIYGFLGVIGALGLMRRQPWSLWAVVGWSVATVYAASVSSFAYNDPTFSQPGTLPGVAGAFVATTLVCAFVVWTARSVTRVPPLAERTHIPPP
jgi:hypothetical protein